MKRFLAAAAALAILGADASAFAASGGVEAAFGNTVVSTYPDGRTAFLWLKPGGKYEGMGRRRTRSSGVWTVKGDKVCLKQKTPKAFPFSYCTAMPAGGVGSRWNGKAVTGEKIKIRLVRGIVENG